MASPPSGAELVVGAVHFLPSSCPQANLRLQMRDPVLAAPSMTGPLYWVEQTILGGANHS
jgi:hypothetical protein